LVSEPGSELADELWDGSATRIAARLAYPEARAALAAARRAGRIDARGLRRAVADLEDAWSALRIIVIDESLARTAGELAERHALRAYDAVHLSCILAVADPELVVATWDRDLARAAVEVGRAVAPKPAS
jgi:uncharacterized protein